MVAALWSQWRTPEQESARKMSVGYSTRCSRQNQAAWEWACRSAARLSRPMMAACWLLRTPLGALYFNLSCALVRRHPPRLRDFALPISTRLIRIIVSNSARETAAGRASHPNGSPAPPCNIRRRRSTSERHLLETQWCCADFRPKRLEFGHGVTGGVTH